MTKIKKENNKRTDKDDVFATMILLLYITGLFMYCRYMVKSVSTTYQRRKNTQEQNDTIKSKSIGQLNLIDYKNAISRLYNQRIKQ